MIASKAKKNRKRYASGRVAFPSIFLAAAWIGLWFVWPSSRLDSPMREPSGTEIFLTVFDLEDANPYLRPDLFARPTKVGFVKRDSSEPSEKSFAALESGLAPSLLKEHPIETVRLPEYEGEAGVMEKDGMAVDFGVRGNHGDISRRSSPHVIWLLSESLEKHGFMMRETDRQALAGGDRSWEAVFFVKVGEDGKPCYVMCEKSSGDRRVDKAAIRAILRGKSTEPGKRHTGRITVSFGFVPENGS